MSSTIDRNFFNYNNKARIWNPVQYCYSSVNCTNNSDNEHENAKKKNIKKVLPDLRSSVRMCRSSSLTLRTSRQ